MCACVTCFHLVFLSSPKASEGNETDDDDDDDDDDEGRINFCVALGPKTTRTRNNKPKQWSHVIVVSAMRRC